VSDAPGCGAWAYARQAGMPTICYPHSTKPYLDMPADAPPPLDTHNLIHMLKQQLGVDFVILAGYLKVVVAIYNAQLAAGKHCLLPSISNVANHKLQSSDKLYHTCVTSTQCI